MDAMIRKAEGKLLGDDDLDFRSPFTAEILEAFDNSVDTPLTGVDTMLQTQGKIMHNWSSSVDTRDSFHKTFWPIWDSVSTLDQVVSTLETIPENFWANSG
ncbi:hypothetical protein Taro_037771 [Colocasia esculenta]|uniref:Uncharacterized protein n=1 Tax=Colocasia esculenta TaxID=4460 RepID=A0A843W1I0_COLES|nr:hypothetical protein [Colocasia esculenta]